MIFLCIYLGEGRGDALMHVYVWEHIAFPTEPSDGCLRKLVGIKCSWSLTMTMTMVYSHKRIYIH